MSEFIDEVRAAQKQDDFFQDLLAAQKAMPSLQKSAINPFYHNKYVPLESVLEAALPILNAHNFVLIQQPSTIDGQPALTTRLIHMSGEEVASTMLLCMKDDGPQAQGSGITYARRYALLATLGLTADVDDDAEATRTQQRPTGGQQRPTPPAFAPMPRLAQNGHERVPTCPQGHGDMKFWPAGTSKVGKPVGANYKCTNRNCQNDRGYPESIWASDWEDHLSRENNDAPSRTADELAELPFE